MIVNLSIEQDQSICSPICEDGVLIDPETCDDGDIGCNSTCTGPKSTYSCEDSNGVTSCKIICGDGIIF